MFSLDKLIRGQLLPSKNQFWLLQSFLWSWYALFVFFSVVLPRPSDLSKGIIHLLLETLLGFALAVVLWVVFRAVKRFDFFSQIIISFIAATVTAAIWTEFKWISFTYVFEGVWQLPTSREFGEWYLFSFSVLVACMILNFGVYYHLLFTAQREQTLLAIATSKEAQLKMLRYQINPHFMLNTLNAISTLILKKDNKTAFDMVEKLSDVLSYSLDQDPKDRVTLLSELKLLNQFVGIEKTRFSDRLGFKIELDDAVKKALVPSMLLQPLVENAIKYAISGREEGGNILVSAKKSGTMLNIVVADDGNGISPSEQKVESGRGVGLRNTKQRLKTLYGANYKLEFVPNEPKGLKVVIFIPCEFQESE